MLNGQIRWGNLNTRKNQIKQCLLRFLCLNIKIFYRVCCFTFQGLQHKTGAYRNFVLRYSSIQMKCQGGNKYALSITVKFDQSTRKFGRLSFARLFKFTKHIALLFYLLLPYLLSCMRGLRNVRTNMYIIKTMTKFCAHWSTVCGMANSDACGIRTQYARSALCFRGP